MATRAVLCGVLILQLLSPCTKSAGDIPDREVLKGNAIALDDDIQLFLKDASGIEQITQYYQNHKAEMTLEEVDLPVIVDDVAHQIAALLGKKMEALKNTVEWAEEIAEQHDWNDTLKKGDIDYVNAKEIDENDPDYVYDAKFKQKVNYDISSVHIPVEIYEGVPSSYSDIEILNGLNWTSGLDKVWEENLGKDPDLLWQYFGSQSGIMRNYPANKWKEDGVDLYDVRRRAWYTQGASSPKDMLILVDTSGSTHGQALALMKQSVKSLLDTLGENDFVQLAHFSEEAELVGCFPSFIQANYRNKLVLFEYVDRMEAKGMASFSAGLEFAFEQIKKFDEEAEPWEGARCNRIIMFLTDGGTEMPEEVFKKYNWPEKNVRIFTYAVGPTANPVAAVKWIACANRGYFEKIPAMGAIRSSVQEYANALSDGLAGNFSRLYLLSRSYQDLMGLGMMTTVTLPVYNRSSDLANQTILGVMGTDVTTKEMQDFVPHRKLGPNGYAFAINNNGYVIFHPNLKAQDGHLKEPPNVDFLDLEYPNAQKELLRMNMINNETDTTSIVTFKISTDELHIGEGTNIYSFTGIPGSNFSLAVVLPDYQTHSVSGFNPELSGSDGADLLVSDASAIIWADWDYCQNVESLSNTSTPVDDFIEKLKSSYGDCDKLLTQQLFFDAKVTKQMEAYWSTQEDPDIEARFIGTNSGLTRIYPNIANINDSFAHMKNTWEAQYYKRAFDSDKWLFHADPAVSDLLRPNYTSPVPFIMAYKAFALDGPEFYKPGVAGVVMDQAKLREKMMLHVPKCSEEGLICYLLDDGAFIMLSSDEDDNYDTGRFLGDVDPVLMQFLYNHTIFLMEEELDFQASCPVKPTIISAGVKNVFIPTIPTFMYEMLSVSWWTSKFYWAYVNFNIYEWLFSSPRDYAMAADDKDLGNYSCIKQMTQYHLSEEADSKTLTECGNCSRLFATTALPKTNLLLVMAEVDCGGDCNIVHLNSAPFETVDPLMAEEKCVLNSRYRARPKECYDYDVREDDTKCGGSAHNVPSVALLLMQSLLLVAMIPFYQACC